MTAIFTRSSGSSRSREPWAVWGHWPHCCKANRKRGCFRARKVAPYCWCNCLTCRFAKFLGV